MFADAVGVAVGVDVAGAADDVAVGVVADVAIEGGRSPS